MKHFRAGRRQSLGLVLATTLAACGGGDICLQCEPSGSPTPDPGVTIQGNVVYSDLGTIPGLTVTICSDQSSASAPSACTDPRFATVGIDGGFVRTRVPSGSQQLFFSTEPNPEPGDSVAKLLQPADEVAKLDEVESGFTASIENVQITFLNGVATADLITVTEDPTPTPTPVATPTPSPASPS